MMKLCWLILLFCGYDVIGSNRTSFSYHVKNLDRINPVLRVGDEVEITCTSCQGDNLTTWDYYDQDIEQVSRSSDGRTVVVRFLDKGVFEIGTNASHAADTTSLLHLNVDARSIFCNVWRSCLTENVTGEAECVSSWPMSSLRGDGLLYARFWLGSFENRIQQLNNTRDILPYDQLLTNELYLLGENPRVKLLKQPLQAEMTSPVKLAGVPRYNSEEHVWIVPLQSTFASGEQLHFSGGTIGLQVESQSVNIMGCSAQSQTIWFDLPKFDLLDVAPSFSTIGSIDVDRCSPSWIVSSDSDPSKLMLAQHLFGGNRKNDFDWTMFDSGLNDVRGLVHLRNGLAFLSSDGIYVIDAISIQPSATLSSPRKLSDLPDPSVSRIRSVHGCDWLLDDVNRTQNDVLVLWDGDSTQVSSVYISGDSGNTFRETLLQGSYSIYAVLPLISSPGMIILAKDMDTNELELLYLHTITQTKTLLYTFESGDPYRTTIEAAGNTVQLTSPVVPSGEIFLLMDDLVLYSPSLGRSWKSILLKGVGISKNGEKNADVSLGLVNGDTFQQVVTSSTGDLVIATKHGRLFAGKTGLLFAYEIISPLTSSNVWALRYRPDGLLIFIMGQSLNDLQTGSIMRQFLLFMKDPGPSYSPRTVQGVLTDKIMCPYLEWSNSNINGQDAFYADMNDDLTIQMTMTHTHEQDWLYISYQGSERNLVEISPNMENLEKSVEGHLIRRKRNLTVSVPRHIWHSTGVGKQHEASGKVVVKAQPTQFTIGCQRHQNLVEIDVGCPRGRHLRYKAPIGYQNPSLSIVPSSCEEEAGKMVDATTAEQQAKMFECTCRQFLEKQFEVSSTNVDLSRIENFYGNLDGLNRDEETWTYKYDYTLFGCPTFVPYTVLFKPRLEIWDFDKKVKDVDADFVMVELHGRNDMYYGMTANDAGCAYEPETWKSKLAKDPNLYTSWGAHNHRDCSIKPNRSDNQPTPGWASLPYEILNRNSTNYLTFKNATTEAPYLFIVTVVDPDYSFCTLQTTFAVEPYGLPMDSFTIFSIIFYVVLASLLLLAGTYMVHRRDIQEAARRDELKRQQTITKKLR